MHRLRDREGPRVVDDLPQAFSPSKTRKNTSPTPSSPPPSAAEHPRPPADPRSAPPPPQKPAPLRREPTPARRRPPLAAGTRAGLTRVLDFASHISRPE